MTAPINGVKAIIKIQTIFSFSLSKSLLAASININIQNINAKIPKIEIKIQSKKNTIKKFEKNIYSIIIIK